MHAALGLGKAVGVFALKQHRDALDAGAFAGQRVGHLDLPAARFGPALIHARAASPPNRCASVPPAPALMLRMQLFRSCGPLRKTFSSSASSSLKNFARSRFQFLLDLRLRVGRLGLAEFEHDAEILELFFGLEQRLDFVAEGVGLVNQLLRLFAVVPEIVGGHQRVEFAQAFLRGGHVKETSAGAQVSPRPS